MRRTHHETATERERGASQQVAIAQHRRCLPLRSCGPFALLSLFLCLYDDLGARGSVERRARVTAARMPARLHACTCPCAQNRIEASISRWWGGGGRGEEAAAAASQRGQRESQNAQQRGIYACLCAPHVHYPSTNRAPAAAPRHSRSRGATCGAPAIRFSCPAKSADPVRTAQHR